MNPKLSDYPQPSVTADCLIFAIENRELQVLLVKRTVEPFDGQWSIPGGFVRVEESLEDAARRVLATKTGLKRSYLEQLYTFGDVGRDPRGRVVTVAYYSLIRKPKEIGGEAGTGEAAWHPAHTPPPLAFDHHKILEIALTRLRNKIRYEPIGFELLPRKFVLTDLQRLYESILQRDLDKRNFRKKILSMNILKKLDEKQQDVPHRAAQYYEFDKTAYKDLCARGFLFEV